MNKFFAFTLSTLLLAACSVNTSSIGSSSNSLLKAYVDNQCRSELNKRNEWRLAALAMSAEKQAEWENKICGCASEEALNNISAAELPQLLTESGRTQVAANVTTKTVSACVQRLFKK